MKIIISIMILMSTNLFGSLLTKGLDAYKNGDKKLASEFYIKGCKNENVYSCIELGKLYVYGDGIKANSKKAKKLFKKACKKGYTGACYQLGRLYYQGGDGVKQNKRKAKAAFGSACTYGHDHACDMYRKLDNQLDLYIIEK